MESGGLTRMKCQKRLSFLILTSVINIKPLFSSNRHFPLYILDLINISTPVRLHHHAACLIKTKKTKFTARLVTESH